MISDLKDKDCCNSDFLLISNKSIYINIYTIFVIDCKTGFITFKHESRCLWESKILSFYNHQTKDYISLAHDGMFIMQPLGEKGKHSKLLKNDKNETVNVHTLNSCNYLKIDKQNHIRF